MKRFLFLLSVLIATVTQAQNVITGFVTQSQLQNAESVVLLEVNPALSGTKEGIQEIARTPIVSNGGFSFDKELFQETDKVYQLALAKNGVTTTVGASKSLHTLKTFILSAKDSMVFHEGKAQYETTNLADIEWTQFKKFEKAQHFNGLNADAVAGYMNNTRGYVKDSLKILLVKLMSIKELDSKNLLEKDIEENTAYYEQLVLQLKDSDLQPEYYAYLESKLSKLNLSKTESRFTLSMLLNGILLLVIVLIGIKYMKAQKNTPKEELIPLSKQETLIKNLILEGKSNKEIAAELFISVSTVKTHITNIYSKLQVSSRKELQQKYQNTTGTSTYLVPE